MDKLITDHLDRMRASVLVRYTSGQIAKWVTKNTFYANDPYSFVDHEYQERVLSDTSKEVNIQKCSQVGISEATARMGLALVNVIDPYTVAYTLPTAHFAGTFAKTRVDPVIETSPTMKYAVHKTNNNNEVKQFGHSFLYIRGAASSNAPISIPVDHLIHDEVDFSDQEVLGQYVSRLTHSRWRRTHRISTPTLPGFGINKHFSESRRHLLFCKCDHCNHQFVPDYYRNVKVPGFKDDLRSITKHVLSRIRWKEAVLTCPKCGDVPSLQPEHREWVCENPDSGIEAAGYQVTPFDAPNVIETSYLVEASTRYDRIQDFENFNLGLPSEDREATLTREDMLALFLHIDPGRHTVNVMGVDVGNTYHFVVAAVDGYGHICGIHTEQVHMGKARVRYDELRRQYRVICTVIDSGPHAETVMAIQDTDVNCYASVYMRSKSILTHNVLDREEEREKGKEFVRQVNVNRNRAFDAYMNVIREGQMSMVESENKELFIQHHTSMKRVRDFDHASGEMSFSWQKTDGEDHFHHAGLYAYIASRIKGVGRNLVALPLAVAFKFRLKDKTTLT